MSGASAARCRRGAGVLLTLLVLVASAVVADGEHTGEWKQKSGDFIELACSRGAATFEEISVPVFKQIQEQSNHEHDNVVLSREQTMPMGTGVQCLMVHRCPLPRGSYVTALAALKYPATKIQELRLYQLPASSLPRADHFAGLDLKTLRLAFTVTPSQPHLNISILESLPKLTKLDVSNAVLPPMPPTSRLRSVMLTEGQSDGAWGGCAELRELILENWLVPEAGENGWLAHCPQLNSLQLERMTAHSMWRALHGARALTTLVMKNNGKFLTPEIQLGTIFETLPLRRLALSNNPFTEGLIKSIRIKSLVELDLSDNEYLGWQSLLPWIVRLRSLKHLLVSRSPKFDFCSANLTTAPRPTLRRLSLDTTRTERLCFREWDSLEYLGLASNQIEELQLLELPLARPQALTVDLRGSTIRSVPLDEARYRLLVTSLNDTGKVVNLNGGDLVLSCDCEHGWFARALRSLPGLKLDGRVTCAGYKSLLDASAERLECWRSECGNCTCRRAWRDNTTVAKCRRGTARAVPRVPGLRVLYAGDNRIETLHADDLPDTLDMLDLSNNNIMRLNETAVARLFALNTRQVRLAGNPLVCDCVNRAVVASLQQHRWQVEDYWNVTCEDGRALHSVVVAQLCVSAGGQVALTAALAAGGVLVALAALAGALHYRYGRQMKIFLYARGLCLCCVEEDELDADRPYDAFISFAHADMRLVVEELLPELEREPNAYKLCVHFRDWEPGEMIPTQIRLSVERSRRTVIILSRNFVESIWGMLEFRLAHVNALVEGRVRIVVVVLDDVVDDEQLDAELRSYLRLHTYVCWGDRWFWEKLRYALPHRPARARERAPRRDVSADDIELAADLQRYDADEAINVVVPGMPRLPENGIDDDTAVPMTPQLPEADGDNDTAVSLTPQLPEANGANDTAVSMTPQLPEANGDNDTAVSMTLQLPEANWDNDTAVSMTPQLPEANGDNDTAVSMTPQLPEANGDNDTAVSMTPQLPQANGVDNMAIPVMPQLLEADSNDNIAVHVRTRLPEIGSDDDTALPATLQQPDGGSDVNTAVHVSA